MRADPNILGRRRDKPFRILPYLAMAGMFLVLILMLPAGIDIRTISALAGVVAISILVVARQLVAFADNADLLRRLDASHTQLTHHEQRLRALLENSSDITATPASELMHQDRMKYPTTRRFVDHLWKVGDND